MSSQGLGAFSSFLNINVPLWLKRFSLAHEDPHTDKTRVFYTTPSYISYPFCKTRPEGATWRPPLAASACSAPGRISLFTRRFIQVMRVKTCSKSVPPESALRFGLTFGCSNIQRNSKIYPPSQTLLHASELPFCAKASASRTNWNSFGIHFTNKQRAVKFRRGLSCTLSRSLKTVAVCPEPSSDPKE